MERFHSHEKGYTTHFGVSGCWDARTCLRPQPGTWNPSLCPPWLQPSSNRNPMEKVNLADKFAKISEYWKPYIAGELNGQLVKLDKLKGEFVWHHHENEDELFLVVKGRFRMELRDRHIWLGEGEFLVVPRGWNTGRWQTKKPGLSCSSQLRR